MVQEHIPLKIGTFILPFNPNLVQVEVRKKIVRHKIPGRDGDVIQLLGQDTKEITFSGVFVRDADVSNVKLLKEFEKKTPLDLVFPLKINQLSNPTKVVVESVTLSARDGEYDMNSYTVKCLEWRPVEVKQNMVTLLNFEAKSNMQAALRQGGYG